jgi:hypothetical protein
MKPARDDLFVVATARGENIVRRRAIAAAHEP